MTLQPGLRAAFRYTATEADTAVAFSVAGEVPVLVTPRVLGLAERATVAAVAGALAGATTGGTRVELDHLAPSPIGVEGEVTRCWRGDGPAAGVAVRVAGGNQPVGPRPRHPGGRGRWVP